MALPLIGVLRRFLPQFLRGDPVLTAPQRRAIRAITQCRTPALGGHHFVCQPCGTHAFAFHSCNHKACPQCGRNSTREWVERELSKRINAPYFLVTFTLPAQLRALFFTAEARDTYNLLFSAAAAALQGCLANPRWLGAKTSGFTAILHTWNQQLLFHPHLHVIVPAAGLDATGALAIGKHDKFLVPVPVLRAAFRRHFRDELARRQCGVDPALMGAGGPHLPLMRTDWGVHIQPVGSGSAAIKYLGAYVRRTAISDARLRAADSTSVTFCWKDRTHGNASKTMTLPGNEFLARYLRHVLPPGLHATRYFGFCHPSARNTRERIAFHCGGQLFAPAAEVPPPVTPLCPCCHKPMRRSAPLFPLYSLRFACSPSVAKAPT